MKKIITFILALTTLVSALCLTSCHGDRNPMPEFKVPEKFNTDKEYNITFWAKHESNNQQRAAYAKAISEFEALYPNVHVTIKEYDNYKYIYDDVVTNIPTGTTPNVCISYPDHIATYMTGENVVVPLDNLIADRKYGLGGSDVRFDSPTLDQIVPEFLDECIINGLYYAMPFMRSTEAIYINKTFVEALGYTVPDVLSWDFVFEVSAAATKKNPDGTYKLNGQKIMKPFIYKSTDNMMIQMLYQLGADYSNESGEVLLFNETTEQLLTDISKAIKNNAFTTFDSDGYPGNYLNKGQCVFGIDSTAGATWMGTEAPNVDIKADEIVEFEMVVRPIPQYDTANPKMISQGPSVCIFNKEDPGEVLASWLFVQYLLTDRTQITYAQTEGYVPVTTKAQSAPEYTEYLSRAGETDENGKQIPLYYDIKIAASRLLLDNVDNTFTTPVFNGSASVRNAAGQMIDKITKDLIGNKKLRINKAYFEELFNNMNAQHHLDQIGSAGEYKKRIDSIPTGSVVLLCSVGGVGLTMLILVLWEKLKKIKK